MRVFVHQRVFVLAGAYFADGSRGYQLPDSVHGQKLQHQSAALLRGSSQTRKRVQLALQERGIDY